MKYYAFLDGPNGEVTKMSEVDILNTYWEYWSMQMEKVGKYEDINPKNCIEDFCVIHWAWEIEKEDYYTV